MKINLLQSQLSINAFMINMIEKDIVKNNRMIIKCSNSISGAYGNEMYLKALTAEKNRLLNQQRCAKKKLAKLVELQKSLKKLKTQLVLLDNIYGEEDW